MKKGTDTTSPPLLEPPAPLPVPETPPASGEAPSHPYQNHQMWTWNAPINGPGWCGPASLYHIIHYYGDHGFYFYRDRTFSGWEWGPDMLEIVAIFQNEPVYIRDTAFGRFIQPDPYGSSWSLLDNVANLYYSKSLADKVYEAYVCSASTKASDVETRRARLNYILEQLLQKDVPVTIHLTSAYLGLGHYVTLIGYDPEKAEVYYVDSLQNEGIHVADVEDLLGGNFYASGMAYSARWDGEWMAFWHTGDDILCDQCGER